MSEAVLVTGCSTGIGRATAVALDRLGYRVYAGVRKEKDADVLRDTGSERMIPILLDVTDSKQIAAAREQIEAEEGERGLAGIVNNAGVLFSGPVEFVPLDDVRQQFEVNVIGDLAIIQAFLPLIRKGHGRVINIGSIGGKIAIPYVSPLCASKFAMECFTDALRVELAPWKIPVVMIEPGLVATAAAPKVAANAEHSYGSLPPEGVELYGKSFKRVMDQAVIDQDKGVAPERVANVVVKALRARRPRTRYVVGRERPIVAVAQFLPDRVLDFVRTRLIGI